jgi:hypothetical protein
LAKAGDGNMPHRSSVPIIWRKTKTFSGSKCSECGKLFYPKRKLCPDCLSEKMKDVALSGIGEVVSFSTIYTAPAGFEDKTPYTIGIIKLAEGPQLTAQIVGDINKTEIGKKVRAIYRIISKDSSHGLINYGYKFELVE